MEKNSSTSIWIVVALVIIIIIAGIWWYAAQQNSTNNNPYTPQQTASSEKSMTSFYLAGLTPGVSGVIDQTNHTITLTVPGTTDITKLIPTITVSEYATVSPASGSVQDFTHSVTYTVTAQDGSTQDYSVSVVKSP